MLGGEITDSQLYNFIVHDFGEIFLLPIGYQIPTIIANASEATTRIIIT
jgi:hypothetical protein